MSDAYDNGQIEHTPARASESAADGHVEKVDHPAHYNSLGALCLGCGRPIECIDVSECFNGNLAQVIQYVWRHDHKGEDPIVELEKAKWLLSREIDRIKRERAKSGAG